MKHEQILEAARIAIELKKRREEMQELCNLLKKADYSYRHAKYGNTCVRMTDALALAFIAAVNADIDDLQRELRALGVELETEGA